MQKKQSPLGRGEFKGCVRETMKKLTFLIAFVALTISSHSNEWEVTHFFWIDHPETIEAPDSNICFILTTRGVTDNKIYKSTDGGESWALFKQINHDYLDAYNISCPDSSNIFLSLEEGHLYHSKDGGENFEEIVLDSVQAYLSVNMFNDKIGILANVFFELKPNSPDKTFSGMIITENSWKTYKNFSIVKNNFVFHYRHPAFINDSILLSVIVEFDTTKFPDNYYQTSLMRLNIKNGDYNLKFISKENPILWDLYVVNDNLFFACGKSNSITGGSGHDAIYKSTDGGESWKRVLDLYTGWSDEKFPGLDSPFGLQSIAFKNENTGIAVGQFGKIVYTYDGGESWIYESNLPDSVRENDPPTMHIRYAGDTPIMATFTGHFFRMTEDTYAPGPSDTLSISGRVWEGDKGQGGIPIAIGYRVTMTDENGYYKFGQLSPGNYTVRALNKYYDDAHPNLQAYYYKPYAYHPEQHEFELTGDTTGIDFDAEDIRDYYNLSGAVTDIDGKGIAGIELSMGDSLTTSTSDGSYEFIRLEKKQYNITPLNEGYTYIPETYVIGLISDTAEIHFQAIPDTSNFIETIEPDTFGLHIENGILHFDELPGAAQMQLTISDLAGRELLNEPMKQEHDINFLSPGVYIISLRKQGEIVRSYKVVVE